MPSKNDALTPAQLEQLLQLARESILHGLAHGDPIPLDPAEFDAQLREPGACFVTINLNEELRGCIGSLEAYRPLVEDVSQNAYAAAFRDPRFLPLTEIEARDMELHLSILSPAQAMSFESEQDLLAQLRPGKDGLIFEEGHLRSTYLPSVWSMLPQPAQFLRHLKQKAGLPANYWSDSVKIYRYTTTAYPAE